MVPESCRCSLLTGNGYKAKVDYDDVVTTKSSSPEYFLVVRWRDDGKNFVWKGFHSYIIFFLDDNKQKPSVV